MYHHLLALHDCLLVNVVHDPLIIEVVSNSSEGASGHPISVLSRRLAVLDLLFYGLDDLVLQRSFVILIRALKMFMDV